MDKRNPAEWGIFAAALLKPPYRGLGFVQLRFIHAAALLKPPYRALGIVQLKANPFS